MPTRGADRRLPFALLERASVFGRVSAEHELRIVRALQRRAQPGPGACHARGGGQAGARARTGRAVKALGAPLRIGPRSG